ncbi:hypothetical protein HanPSC8_Chr04g0152171 [Helianthus annuus]|nr:hypothetical protein HanPSC8_Chr04g0152171 [Helianthus annuus]
MYERIVATVLVEKEAVFVREEEIPELGSGASPEKKTKWWGWQVGSGGRVIRERDGLYICVLFVYIFRNT